MIIQSNIFKIIEEFNETYPPDNSFENEHFIYWVREEYIGTNGKVTREEFKQLRDYVAENKCLPGEENKHRIYNTGVESFQYILRYSKKYQQLEYYTSTCELRANNYRNDKKVIIMNKKIKHFSMTFSHGLKNHGFLVLR